MKHESILRKKFELDRKSTENVIKKIENSIKELDSNYMIDMESLLIQLEYAKADLEMLTKSTFEECYGEEDDD